MEREFQAARSAERRKDAHEKIQLGGLVAKAGLRDEDKAVLLGLLVEGFETLKISEARERYRQRGKAIFEDDRKAASASDRADGDDDRRVLDTTGW
ncbi:conjugal transfer protein Dtr system [Brucella intermedia M86]|uniref:Conjugal transfer protein Dtr system n=1 Tax=Brucella intermedia M86 TaxID=1234597 RepID=M5JSW3_9HYPH|nr:conjugal transfer protein Dtr system [Brucella intermedia M86]